MKYADMAQAQAAVLIAEMEKGHPFLPFLKPGGPALVNGLPYNPTTGRAYRGGNMVMLWIAGMVEGYEDRRWLTYRQAQSIGAQVRKGAKSVPLRYVIYPERDGEGVLTAAAPRPFHFSVFNAAQIDGMPLAPSREMPAPEQRNAQCFHRIRGLDRRDVGERLLADVFDIGHQGNFREPERNMGKDLRPSPCVYQLSAWPPARERAAAARRRWRSTSPSGDRDRRGSPSDRVRVP
jgi:hypothetical protein